MTTKKQIDVKDQVTLSFEKSFKFCKKGISYRLFRSLLTLAVVVVAVAFFTVLLSEGLIVRSTAAGVAREMLSEREADALLMHLFHRYSSRDFSEKLASIEGDSAAVREFSRIAGITEGDASDLVRQSVLEQAFLEFFGDISAGKRAVLVKKNTGRDVFVYLADKEEWKEFQAALQNMRSVRLPEDVGVLRAFLDNRNEFMAMLEKVLANRGLTVAGMEEKLDALTGGSTPAMWVAKAADDEVEQWRGIAIESGFDLSEDKMARVRELMRLSALEEEVGKVLQTQEKRSEWKKEFQNSPGLEDKILMLKDERVGAILGDSFTLEQRAAVADRFARIKHLRALIAKLAIDPAELDPDASFLGGRQIFLIAISFLVCMVGITNAMLMSITERFREIATMKCLGATDGFILKQFLIEAAIQGFVGGTVGMVIGMIISVLKSTILLGGTIFVHFPALPMLYCAVFTVVVGIILAMLASIYPSRAAASMAPMDAMRVE